jgi:uncharacterized protein YbjT (DUF2867 family)
MKQLVVLGGTGYLGRPLIEKLIGLGLPVTAVVRGESVRKLPVGCGVVIGNVLDASTYQNQLPRNATFVHLVGTPHPAPWKGHEFRTVDQVALEQSILAATHTSAEHFVFVSVAHPAPVMKEYIAVRMQCEERLRECGIPATILRPWYVLGPGHYWPYALLPVYKLLEAMPRTKAGAVRLGLVTRLQMIRTLVAAVVEGGNGFRVLETAEIRRAGRVTEIRKFSAAQR